MAVILPDGEDLRLSRFLRRNLPPELFDEASPVLCFPGKELPVLPPDAVLIADSAAPLPAGAEEYRVITCGRSPKDTFTFSSRGEEDASVALMRAVDTPFGAAEPMEFPVLFPAGAGDLAVLGTAAALILSGAAAGEPLRFYPPDPDRPSGKDVPNSK